MNGHARWRADSRPMCSVRDDTVSATSQMFVRHRDTAAYPRQQARSTHVQPESLSDTLKHVGEATCKSKSCGEMSGRPGRSRMRNR